MASKYAVILGIGLFLIGLSSLHSLPTTYNLENYNNVYHVSEAGNNSNLGTENSPFATIEHAVNTAGSGDAIVIGAGTFDVTNDPGGYGHTTGLNNNGKNIDFIGQGLDTVLSIDGTSATSRDLHFYSGTGFSKIYNVKFVRDSNGRSTNYMNAFFGFGSVRGEIYNSVFKTIDTSTTNPSANPSLTYYNHGAVSVKVYNSVFDLERDMVNSYSGYSSSLMKVYNSVSNFRLTTGNAASYHNFLENVTFDEEYNITSSSSSWQDAGVGFVDADGSVADLGLTGGVNAIAPPIPEPSSLLLLLASLVGWGFFRKNK